MVSPYFLPIVGGSETQAWYLSRALQARGLAVEAVTCQMTGLSVKETREGLVIYRLPGILNRIRYEDLSPLARLKAQFLFNLIVARFIYRHRWRYDVIHRHTAAYPFDLVFAGRLGKGTVAKVATAGDITFAHSQVAALSPHWGSFIRRLNAWALKKVDAIISLSAEIEAELKSLGLSDNIRHIPNGVDTDLFRPVEIAARNGLRERLGLPEGPVILFSGRLVRRKGVDVLLRAAWEIITSGQTIHILILGQGPEGGNLRALVQELNLGSHVTFLGEKGQEEVASYLQSADLYVFPSRREGLPNALLEAMAAGLAVVGSATGGVMDVIESEVNGLLVAPDDTAELAQAITVLLTDEEKRKVLGTTAREKVIADFSLNRVTDKYIELYREIGC